MKSLWEVTLREKQSNKPPRDFVERYAVVAGSKEEALELLQASKKRPLPGDDVTVTWIDGPVVFLRSGLEPR